MNDLALPPPDGTGRPVLAQLIAAELRLGVDPVKVVTRLLGEGATVPFIARYRKEATGGLDEEQLRKIQARHAYLVALGARREAIENEIAGQGKLTAELRAKLAAATTKAELEDLYLPFKPKRRTRAMQARERGLEPLAELMWQQPSDRPEHAARRFVDASLGVPDVAAALAGARDICAERLADDAELRRHLRQAYREHGHMAVKKTKEYKDKATKFDNYSDFSGRAKDMPSHRVLAVERGEAEGVLKAKLELELERHYTFAAGRLGMKRASPWLQELRQVVEDTVKRLVAPSAQSEVRGELRLTAHEAAVEVFARNLRELLLAAPLGEKAVLGIDPGQRTGCKCAVVSETGKFLENDTLYLVQGEAKEAEAVRAVVGLLRKHRVKAVAVGNGTHGRETAGFVRRLLAEHASQFTEPPVCVSVSESGASIYSASEVARKEFPELDLTVRGAISIARRLQDPLAELVKLDPKTIGVGQYQHDVDGTLLDDKLAEVVESCVNQVGVELNTASARLLSFVAGIGPKVAENIVAHRDRNGRFESRRQLLDVKGLGPKAFEQAAGFLRIRDGSHPLDRSGVHPERYALVEAMAKDLGLPLTSLVGHSEQVSRVDLARYQSGDVGRYTLQHIVEQLREPGADPRSSFEAPRFKDDINSVSDLAPGMLLEGVVTNVTAFGAFLDVGVHQDGLVHVSELADRFVKDPAQVVHVGQRLTVRVLAVDLDRGRISLSAKAGRGDHS